MWSLWWYLSHAIPSTPTLAPCPFPSLITTVISVMCHRGLSRRNALTPMFTVSKEASTESCDFTNYLLQFPYLESEKECEKTSPSASVSRWWVLFFAEKTSLLRVYPGRCVGKSSKVSLDGFSSLKLFKSTLISWSTAARRRWYDSKHACQSYTLKGPGVFTAIDGVRDQYITFLSPLCLLYQRISTEKFYKSNIHERFQLDLSCCSSAPGFAFLWKHNWKQNEFLSNTNITL